MTDHPSIEELIIDDSFTNYCFQKNEADSLYWRQYINDYPFEREKVEKARQIVLGLHVMLKQEHAENRTGRTSDRKEARPLSKVISAQRIFRYTAIVAAVFMLILAIKETISISYQTTDEAVKPIAANAIPDSTFSYKTANGEKKVITLSDSTKIWLNAGSSLRIDEAYGKGSRKVYLSGEALFDVIHDESQLFIVYTDKYEVKDLGTVFNVKAYPDDKQSETALIKGKIEIQMVNSARTILLSPNQKAVINDRGEFNVEEKEAPSEGSSIKLLPLSYNRKDNTVIETAWTQNRLEIVNEDFREMKDKLERWFDVKITIEDNEVGKYPFTATFEKENIHQVLQALQSAYHFNYTIKGSEISISK